MPRYKLTLEYDGAPFVGWQRQTNGLSVQEVIETALNALCGERVAIRAAERVSEDFDARVSAVRRHYLYRIVNRRAPLTVGRGHAWLVNRKLDAGTMHAAARHLVGCHDFST